MRRAGWADVMPVTIADLVHAPIASACQRSGRAFVSRLWSGGARVKPTGRDHRKGIHLRGALWSPRFEGEGRAGRAHRVAPATPTPF